MWINCEGYFFDLKCSPFFLKTTPRSTIVTSLYLLTYLHTPWSRVLLEELIDFQLVKTFPAFYGIRRFITAFASACHLSLSWASLIQSIPPHPTSWRSILTLCRRATQKCVIALPCVVDGSCISTFSYIMFCTCVCQLVWLTYRFNVIDSLMQDAWFSSYK